MAAKDELGRDGEAVATRYLTQLGYHVVDRNWRCRFGEIDIIVEREHLLVFVEVKARSSVDFGHPFEAITFRKLARLRRLAAEWCSQQPARNKRDVRLDAIAVIGPRGHEPLVEHLEGIG